MPTAQQLTEILNAALQKLWRNEGDLFTNSFNEERSMHERAIVAYNNIVTEELLCMMNLEELMIKPGPRLPAIRNMRHFKKACAGASA